MGPGGPSTACPEASKLPSRKSCHLQACSAAASPPETQDDPADSGKGREAPSGCPFAASESYSDVVEQSLLCPPPQVPPARTACATATWWCKPACASTRTTAPRAAAPVGGRESSRRRTTPWLWCTPVHTVHTVQTCAAAASRSTAGVREKQTNIHLS